MAMAETVRARFEELRTRIRTRLEELRGQSGSGAGVSPLAGQRLPIISEIRAKGLATIARERLEKIRAGGILTEGGILTKISGEEGKYKLSDEKEKPKKGYVMST